VNARVAFWPIVIPLIACAWPLAWIVPVFGFAPYSDSVTVLAAESGSTKIVYVPVVGNLCVSR
jgi:hypothetical protein